MRKLIIPLLLAAVGLCLMAGALLPLISLFTNKGTSFVAPGETKVSIAKAGTYTLWHEAKTTIDGTLVNHPDDLPPGTTILVSKQPDGVDVPIIRSSGKTTMETTGTRRVAVGKFKFTSPGDYKISVSGIKEKRAFYIAEARFFRVMASVIGLGLTGILFLVVAVGAGIYAQSRKSGNAVS